MNVLILQKKYLMYYNRRKIELPKIKIVGSIFQIKVEEASLKTFTN